MAEESRFLTFHGMRVHCVVARPETELRSRVLLLCSPIMSTFHWRKLLPELSQLGCLTALVDLPGFGQSDCSGEATQDHDLRASIVWGILDDIDAGMGTPMSMWHLIGHGTACITLLRMFAQYPDSTQSQVHISPLFNLQLNRRLRTALPSRFDGIIRDELRAQALIEQLAAYHMDGYIVDHIRRPLLRQGARENFLRMVQHAHANETDTSGFCPTMAIWGEHDPLIDEAAVRAIHAHLPNAETHLLKTAGHFPMETHSRALRDYLRGWLRFNA